MTQQISSIPPRPSSKASPQPSTTPSNFSLEHSKPSDDKIFQDFVMAFRQSGQAIPTIVYDVDDILWGLMARIAISKNLDLETCYAIFDLSKNPHLSPSERDYIIASFANADMFKDIDFYPGICDILRPQELGAQVKINSNCFSQEIADLKVAQLLQVVPDLTIDDIQVNVINYEHTLKKPLDPATTILVDDSPHNVANSPALLNVMPKNVAWSCHPTAKIQVQEKPVIWQPDLTAINDFIFQTIKHLTS